MDVTVESTWRIAESYGFCIWGAYVSFQRRRRSLVFQRASFDSKPSRRSPRANCRSFAGPVRHRVTYKYHLAANTPEWLKESPRPLCGQEKPTATDCKFWTRLVDTGPRRGFQDYIPDEKDRTFRLVSVRDYNSGCHHIDTCTVCEHCEAIAASQKLSPGLYRCDGRLLG